MDKNLQLAMPLPMDAIANFCKKWGIVKLSVFGSILRDDFRPDSDVDFLAEFDPSRRYTFSNRFDMEVELGKLLGRRVDIVSEANIRRSPNWIRKEAILSTAECIIHAA
jgi:uncharacterized protein